jgi:hypothetical protein
LLGRGALTPLSNLIQVDDIAHAELASPRCPAAGTMILYLRGRCVGPEQGAGAPRNSSTV